MRALLAALAMTAGSFAFQIALQAGVFNHLFWVAPWAWGASAGLWVWWLLSHPKIETEWLKDLHVRMGRGVHPARAAVAAVVMLIVALAFLAWTHRNTTTAAVPPPPQSAPSDRSKEPAAPRKPRDRKAESVPKKQEPPTVSTSGPDSPAVGSVSQGPCSNLQVGGSGNQSTNCTLTLARSLTDGEKVTLVDALSKEQKTMVTVWAVEDGQALATDVYNSLKAAGWTMQDPDVQMMFLAKPMRVDIALFIPGDPSDHSDVDNAPLAGLVHSLESLKRFKVRWARSDKITGNVIKVAVGPPAS